MKKKLLMIVLILFLVVGCSKKEETTPNENETEKETEVEKEIVTHTDTEIINKLIEYGNKLYDSKEYLNYTKYGEQYFMCLEDLEKLNYDVEYFVDSNKKSCNKKRTGIYFDPTNSVIPKGENANPISVVFYECTEQDFALYEETLANENNTQNSN